MTPEQKGMGSNQELVSAHYRGGAPGQVYAQWQAAGRRLAIEPARRFQPFIRPHDTVLDFGCGYGDILAALHCARRIGVEPNPEPRQEAANLGLEVHASTEELPDAFVDVVISNHCLEHSRRPLDEILQLVRVIKPGGRFVIVVPIDDWRTQRHHAPADPNHHLYTWTPQLLGNLLTEAGLNLQELRIIDHAWPPKTAELWHFLPRPLFDAIGVAWAHLRRRRQLLAVARKAKLR